MPYFSFPLYYSVVEKVYHEGEGTCVNTEAGDMCMHVLWGLVNAELVFFKV